MACRVDRLTVEVGQFHVVRVDDRQMAYACRREIAEDRRSQTANANDGNPSTSQSLLSLEPEVRELQLPIVAGVVVPGQALGRSGWQAGCDP